MNKKELEIILSSLEGYSVRDVKLEQYPTPSSVAAEILWDAQNDILGKKVVDLGCGNGILGIGALLVGAKEVYFLDVDENVLKIAKENLKFVENKLKRKFKCKFILGDVVEFDKKVDVVLQNPPFGTKNEHADREFLEMAMDCADIVYSFHKSSTCKFVKAFLRDGFFKVVKEYKFKFPLKAAFGFHKRVVGYIEVTCFKGERFKKGE